MSWQTHATPTLSDFLAEIARAEAAEAALRTQEGAASGIATLGSDSVLTLAQRPPFKGLPDVGVVGPGDRLAVDSGRTVQGRADWQMINAADYITPAVYVAALGAGANFDATTTAKVFTPSLDAGPAVNAAVAAANARCLDAVNGGPTFLRLPAGVYAPVSSSNFSTTTGGDLIAISPNFVWNLVIYFDNVALTLSPQCSRVLGFFGGNTHDWFRKVRAAGVLHVDAGGFTKYADGLTSRAEAIIGNNRQGAYTSYRSFSDIDLFTEGSDLRIFNMPGHPNNAGGIMRGVGFSVQQIAGVLTGDKTFGVGSWMGRIRVGGRVRGAPVGFHISGHGSTNQQTAAFAYMSGGRASTIMGRTIEVAAGWEHNSGLYLNPNTTAANCQIGGAALYADVAIRRGRGRGSADVGIEVDSMVDALIEGVTIDDCRTGAFTFAQGTMGDRSLFSNRFPLDPYGAAAQLIRHVDCTVRRARNFQTAHGNIYLGPDATPDNKGWTIYHAALGIDMGAVTIEGGQFFSDASLFSNLTPNGPVDIASYPRRVLIQGLEASLIGWTQSQGSNLAPPLIRMSNHRGGTPLVLDAEASLTLHGTVDGAGSQVSPVLFPLSAPEVVLNARARLRRQDVTVRNGAVGCGVTLYDFANTGNQQSDGFNSSNAFDPGNTTNLTTWTTDWLDNVPAGVASKANYAIPLPGQAGQNTLTPVSGAALTQPVEAWDMQLGKPYNGAAQIKCTPGPTFAGHKTGILGRAVESYGVPLALSGATQELRLSTKALEGYFQLSVQVRSGALAGSYQTAPIAYNADGTAVQTAFRQAVAPVAGFTASADGSAVLTVLNTTDMTQFAAGQGVIKGAVGVEVPAGTTILSVDQANFKITLSSSIASTAGQTRTFVYGTVLGNNVNALGSALSSTTTANPITLTWTNSLAGIGVVVENVSTNANYEPLLPLLTEGVQIWCTPFQTAPSDGSAFVLNVRDANKYAVGCALWAADMGQVTSTLQGVVATITAVDTVANTITVTGYPAGYVFYDGLLCRTITSWIDGGVVDDGVQSYLYLDAVRAGVRTSLMTVGERGAINATGVNPGRWSGVGIPITATARASGAYWTRLRFVEGLVAADYFTGSAPGGTTDAAAAGNQWTGYYTLSASDQALFGGPNISRFQLCGLSSIPADAAYSLDDFTMTFGTTVRTANFSTEFLGVPNGVGTSKTTGVLLRNQWQPASKLNTPSLLKQITWRDMVGHGNLLGLSTSQVTEINVADGTPTDQVIFDLGVASKLSTNVGGRAPSAIVPATSGTVTLAPEANTTGKAYIRNGLQRGRYRIGPGAAVVRSRDVAGWSSGTALRTMLGGTTAVTLGAGPLTITPTDITPWTNAGITSGFFLLGGALTAFTGISAGAFTGCSSSSTSTFQPGAAQITGLIWQPTTVGVAVHAVGQTVLTTTPQTVTFADTRNFPSTGAGTGFVIPAGSAPQAATWTGVTRGLLGTLTGLATTTGSVTMRAGVAIVQLSTQLLDLVNVEPGEWLQLSYQNGALPSPLEFIAER